MHPCHLLSDRTASVLLSEMRGGLAPIKVYPILPPTAAATQE